MDYDETTQISVAVPAGAAPEFQKFATVLCASWKPGANYIAMNGVIANVEGPALFSAGGTVCDSTIPFDHLMQVLAQSARAGLLALTDILVARGISPKNARLSAKALLNVIMEEFDREECDLFQVSPREPRRNRAGDAQGGIGDANG